MKFIKDLRKGEKVAQEKVDQYEFRIRSLKRYVEKTTLAWFASGIFRVLLCSNRRIEELSKH